MHICMYATAALHVRIIMQVIFGIRKPLMQICNLVSNGFSEITVMSTRELKIIK